MQSFVILMQFIYFINGTSASRSFCSLS